MRTALAIFVKTPSLSLVKTRLAATIGRVRAEEFYHASLGAVKVCAQQADVTPFWAVAEIEGVGDPLWSDFLTLHTGGGDLGARQYHIYRTLLEEYDRVILIGADAPQITADLLRDAIKALDTHDFVIGPAHDGGYYLFGGRMHMDASVWSDVPWSTEHTREALITKLPAKPVFLSFLSDVDTHDDLQRILREMPKQKSAQQQGVVDWIESL